MRHIRAENQSCRRPTSRARTPTPDHEYTRCRSNSGVNNNWAGAGNSKNVGSRDRCGPRSSPNSRRGATKRFSRQGTLRESRRERAWSPPSPFRPDIQRKEKFPDRFAARRRDRSDAPAPSTCGGSSLAKSVGARALAIGNRRHWSRCRRRARPYQERDPTRCTISLALRARQDGDEAKTTWILPANRGKPVVDKTRRRGIAGAGPTNIQRADRKYRHTDAGFIHRS